MGTGLRRGPTGRPGETEAAQSGDDEARPVAVGRGRQRLVAG